MNTHKFILSFCVFLFPVIAFAQSQPAIYFKNDRVTTDSAGANYYRVVDLKNGDSFNYTEYHKDGSWKKASAKGTITNPIKIDEEIFYKNGQLADINRYENGRLIKNIGYYSNSILMQVITARNGWPNMLVAYDADSSGRVHIKNGNGVRQEADSITAVNIKQHYTFSGPYKDGLKEGLWKGTNDSGFTFEEKYEAGRLISGITQTPAGKKYRYNKLFEYPRFNGSMDRFEKHIAPNLKNITDTVGLKFFKAGYLQLSYVINADGNITSLRGFKTKGHVPVELELKAALPRNEPAKMRGAPVAYPILNNADYFTRNNFSITFNTDIYLYGTYKEP